MKKEVGSNTHPFMDRNAYKLLGKSLTPNIVLVVALVSFIPMLVVSAMVLDQFSRSHNEKLYAHLEEVVQKHTHDIDGFLNERLNNLQFLSESCGFDILFDEVFLQEKLLELQKTYGDIFEDLGIINDQGIQE